MARDKTIRTTQVAGWFYDLILCGREGIYMIQLDDADGCPDDCEALGYEGDITEQEAIALFNAEMDKRRAEMEPDGPAPNWEAQARYDEEHGTINGYHPAQVRYDEEFPYGG